MTLKSTQLLIEVIDSTSMPPNEQPKDTPSTVPIIIVEDKAISPAIPDKLAAMGFRPTIVKFGFTFTLHPRYSALHEENLIGLSSTRMSYEHASQFLDKDLDGDAVVFMDCHLQDYIMHVDVKSLTLPGAVGGLTMEAIKPGVALAHRALNNPRFTGIVVFESSFANAGALRQLQQIWPQHASRLYVVPDDESLPLSDAAGVGRIVSYGIDVFLKYKGCFSHLRERLRPDGSDRWFDDENGRVDMKHVFNALRDNATFRRYVANLFRCPEFDKGFQGFYNERAASLYEWLKQGLVGACTKSHSGHDSDYPLSIGSLVVISVAACPEPCKWPREMLDDRYWYDPLLKEDSCRRLENDLFDALVGIHGIGGLLELLMNNDGKANQLLRCRSNISRIEAKDGYFGIHVRPDRLDLGKFRVAIEEVERDPCVRKHTTSKAYVKVRDCLAHGSKYKLDLNVDANIIYIERNGL